ncbi:universal stress protein [Termitidicoccus mucosus]|uniref:Universal stress protein UspA n=1 Tax=Termitidicoccus mucosus TaxID=1184151 RepID=A0A178IDW7_9BACT|nr:universal stress protein UspA [Opitutaceae bacterium TSB47]
MYKKILVALENTSADHALLEHVGALAVRLGSELLLLHVADGWAARNFDQLKLAESEEIKADRAYLAARVADVARQGLRAESMLAMGNPPQEILRVAAEHDCDLIALASHGHKALADVVHGSTIAKVRHNTMLPLLVVHGGKPAPL